MSEYEMFLRSKVAVAPTAGIEVDPAALHPSLFPFQRAVVAWALARGRAALFLECGCVAGETIMQGPDGSERIDVLAAHERPIRVWSLNEHGRAVPAWASAPFLKGEAPLYEFVLASGQRITVTGHHRFLAPDGWRHAATLRAGERIAAVFPWSQVSVGDEGARSESDSSSLALRGMLDRGGHAPQPHGCGAPRLLSTEGYDQRVFPEDARRCAQTPLDSPGHYWRGFHPDDAQPQLAGGSVLTAAPSPSDVRAHIPHWRHEGVRVDVSGYIHRGQPIARPSRTDYCPYDQNCCAALPGCHAASLLPTERHNSLRDGGQSFSPASPQPLGAEPHQGLAESRDDQFSRDASFVTISTINYIGTGRYYDLHVPIHENYLANGVWNHNTGKTIQQLVWADEVCRRTGGRVLILAPLAVGRQTADEAARVGIEAAVARSQADADAGPAIAITNYEMLEHVDPSRFVGVVLDESAILKSYRGATKRRLLEAFAATPYRLCCTATPAPNDHMELGNHSAFLGVMSSAEMLTRWFINDTMQAGNYRLKRHAERAYWDWVASWAVSARRPSDLGFSDDGYDLPPLQMRQLTVQTDLTVNRGDHLFRQPDLNATGIHHEARLTAPARCATVAALVNVSSEAWAVWCNTNDEADRLAALIPDAVEVRGSESVDAKERKLMAFVNGEARVLITKPTIAGWGLNFQHCSHTAFVGLTYSFEQVYQALRRFYRFGQTRPVDAYIVAAETEGQVVAVFERKRAAHERMFDSMSHVARPLTLTRDLTLTDYDPRAPMTVPAWLHSYHEEMIAS